MGALGRMLNDALLAVSVLCGPGIWLITLASAYMAWRPGIDGWVALQYLWVASVFPCWAFWGIISGPRRVRHWWFFLASLLNAIAGVLLVVGDLQYRYFTGALFLGYSLWQFIIFRSRAPKRLNK